MGACEQSSVFDDEKVPGRTCVRRCSGPLHAILVAAMCLLHLSTIRCQVAAEGWSILWRWLQQGMQRSPCWWLLHTQPAAYPQALPVVLQCCTMWPGSHRSKN